MCVWCILRSLSSCMSCLLKDIIPLPLSYWPCKNGAPFILGLLYHMNSPSSRKGSPPSTKPTVSRSRDTVINNHVGIQHDPTANQLFEKVTRNKFFSPHSICRPGFWAMVYEENTLSPSRVRALPVHCTRIVVCILWIVESPRTRVLHSIAYHFMENPQRLFWIVWQQKTKYHYSMSPDLGTSAF